MLQNMMRASMLDRAFYNIVEDDSKYNGQAGAVVVVAAITGAINAAFGAGDDPVIRMALYAILAGVVGWLLYSGIATVVGNAIGGDTDFGQTSRVLGFAQAPMVLQVIPLIGWPIGSVLMLIASVVGLREANDFSTGKALGTAIIGWVIFSIARGFLGGVF